MIAGVLEIQMMANMARLTKDMQEAKGVVGSAMKGIERDVGQANKSLSALSDGFRNALSALGLGIGIAQLVSLTDQYTKFTSQLKLAADSQTEYVRALSDVRRISNLAQADLGATGVLYARITNATKELGVSQKQVADISETVSLALKASGATTAESASAMLQLSQAFGSGVLRGQEFNAVNEAAPRLMRALAEGIGVPVGQLRSMAEAGLLTSEVMARALPRSLAELRKEAASVQTIAGAFQVLKNNVMEFVGAGSQANGSARMIASGLELLANNLALLMGIAATLTASKLAQWFAGVATSLYAKTSALLASTAATNAERTATVAAAAAEIARAESSLAFIAAERARTVVQMQAAQATMAATAAIGAQSAALAANTAATAVNAAAIASLAALGRLQATANAQMAAAQLALNGATAAGGAAAGLAARALGFLGGPIGALITVLGLGATAWAAWGGSGKSANEQLQNAVTASTPEILAALEKQNVKLRERVMLLKAGNPELAKGGGSEAETMAGLMTKAKALEVKGLTSPAEGYLLAEYYRQIATINEKLKERKDLTTQIEGIGQQSKAAAWAEEFATKGEKLAATLAKAKKELGDAFTPELEARIRAQYKEAEKTDSAYRSLNKALSEKLLVGRELTEVEKLQLDLNALSKKDLAGITALELADLKAKAAKVEANKREKDALESLAKTLELQGKLIDERTDLVEADQIAQGAALIASRKNIEQIEFETTLIGKSNEARETAIALRALETSGIDKNSAAYANQVNALREALANQQVAKAADEQRRKSVEAADAVRQREEEEWKSVWSSIESSGRNVWQIMTAGGEGTAKAVGKAFKTSLIDMMYQFAAKPIMLQIGASIAGSMGMSTAASAATSAMGGGMGAFNLASMGNTVSGWMGGPTIGSSLFGAGAAIEGLGGAYGTAAALGELGGIAGAAGGAGLTATGAASAGMGALSGALAAVPVWGWAAMAALAVLSMSGDDRGPKPSELVIRGGAGGMLGLEPVNVNGSGNVDANNPAYAQAAALLNQIPAGMRDSLIGKGVTTGPSDSAEAMIKALFDMPEIQAATKAAEELAVATKQVEETDRAAAEAAKALADQRTSLEIQALEAEGNIVSAMNLRREVERAATAASNLDMLERRIAAEDLATASLAAAEASKAAAALVAERRDLEIRLMEAQGNAAGVLAIRRADEMKASNDLNREMLRQIFTAEDLTKATASATLAQEEAARVQAQVEADRRAAVMDAVGVLRDAYQREASALEQMAAKWATAAQGLRAYGDTLVGVGTGGLTYAAAARQFNEVARRTQLGDMDAIGSLQGVSERFRTASLAGSSSALDYARDLARISTAIDLAASVADRQENVALQERDLLKSQVETMIDMKEELVTTRQAMQAVEAKLAELQSTQKDVARETKSNKETLQGVINGSFSLYTRTTQIP